jgi:hypothetical protein
MNEEGHKTIGNNNAKSRAREERGDWEIYTARFRKSGGRVPYLRVLSQNGRSYVLAVTDAEEQKGKVVAACLLKEDGNGSFFVTTNEFRGHLDTQKHAF